MSDQQKPSKVSSLMSKLTGKPLKDYRYSVLAEYDTVFLIDDSGSMKAGKPTRWDQVEKALKDLVPICTQWDSNGIDIYFLNDDKAREHVKSPKKVMAAFKEVGPPARGPTFTGHRLNDILKPYIADCVARHKAGLDPPKPLNVIVITDGSADDKPGEYLKVFAKTLDAIDAEPRQLGVQFCQVGDEKDAAEALRKLDDELPKKEGCRDFIDTVPYTKIASGGRFNDDLVLKTLLGSIMRRQDRKVIQEAEDPI